MTNTTNNCEHKNVTVGGFDMWGKLLYFCNDCNMGVKKTDEEDNGS